MKLLKNISMPNLLIMIPLASFLFFMACTGEREKNTTETTNKTAPAMGIHEATLMGNIKVIKAHVATKSDLNKKDEYGSIPLTVAATFGKTEAARILIKGGADVNAQSGDGSTPLHTAAFFCRIEIVEALLAAGADTDVRNNYGVTALESISGPFDDVRMIYDQISKDLGPLGLKLDYDHLRNTRPVIAEMLSKNQL